MVEKETTGSPCSASQRLLVGTNILGKRDNPRIELLLPTILEMPQVIAACGIDHVEARETWIPSALAEDESV